MYVSFGGIRLIRSRLGQHRGESSQLWHSHVRSRVVKIRVRAEQLLDLAVEPAEDFFSVSIPGWVLLEFGLTRPRDLQGRRFVRRVLESLVFCNGEALKGQPDVVRAVLAKKGTFTSPDPFRWVAREDVSRVRRALDEGEDLVDLHFRKLSLWRWAKTCGEDEIATLLASRSRR